MPAMPNPFAGDIDGEAKQRYNLIQRIRADIIAEHEAIFLYDAHANATSDPVARKILMDIRDEEKVHVGELEKLLKYLDPMLAAHLENGEKEAGRMIQGVMRSNGTA
jgi:rubrerythrin